MNLNIIKCWFGKHELRVKEKNISNSIYFPEHLVICKRCGKKFFYDVLYDELLTRSYYYEPQERREEKRQRRKEIFEGGA